MSDTEPNPEHLLQRFRDALRAADECPSEEHVAALREAAAPLMDRLRSESVAAGNPEDDDAALFRWVRSVLLRRQISDPADQPSDTIPEWRSQETG
jgi:hypothetical protein